MKERKKERKKENENECVAIGCMERNKMQHQCNFMNEVNNIFQLKYWKYFNWNKFEFLQTITKIDGFK